MIEAQLKGRKVAAAVLAAIPVSGEDAATIQMEFLPGRPVEREQTDDPGNPKLEIHRPNPVLLRLLAIGTQLADLAPGLEIMIGKPSFFKVDYLDQIAEQQPERPADVDHVDGHVEPIEHQHAGLQGPVGLRRVRGCLVERTARPRMASMWAARPGTTLRCRTDTWHWQTPRVDPAAGGIQAEKPMFADLLR